MHKEILTFLTDRGLTSTEIKLYVQGVADGALTPAEYAKRTGVQRTTVYSALSALEQKGFTSMSLAGETRTYTMIEPAMIERQLAHEIDVLQEQKKDFAEVLPLFSDIISGDRTGSTVQQFSGEQGVRTAIDQALFCASKQWKIISPTKNYFSETDAAYAKYFIKTRKQRNIVAQSLWEPKFVSSRKFSQSTIDVRNPRVLAGVYEGRFTSTIILFDQKVLFINSVDELSAVVISSSGIYSTMELFFDGVWGVSKKVASKYIKK